MIGKAFTPGRGFKALALYLERGQPGVAVPPHRVDWVETRNLPTNDIHAAARIMAATARDSDSVQPPLYHFIISFDPGDPMDRDAMCQVAHRTLRDLGLQEHQAVIVAHRDRAHRHLHQMVNRVHPERLNVWNNWFDYRRIERSLRKQEEELGLRIVPGKHAPVPEQSRERAPAPRRVRGDAAFLARAQAQAGPHLLRARSWQEVERGLGEHGLSVQIKNGGMVVTDGLFEVKASEIDRAASRRNLERRLGALGEYRARQAVTARTLDEHAARVKHAPTAAEQVSHAAAPRPVEVQPRTPAPPPAAPKAPAPAAALRPQPAPRLKWWQVTLHRVADVIRAARLSDAEARSLDDIFEAGYVQAPQELKRLRDLHQRALDDARRLRGALGKIYTDAADAARGLRRYEREHGIAQTLAALRAKPEQFGTLQTQYWRTAQARARLPEVVEPLQAAVRSAKEFPSRDELGAAEKRAEEGIKAGIAAREARRALPIRAQYEQKAADLLAPLLREASPQWIAEQLGRLLPTEDREAAQMVERVLRAAITRSRERAHGIDLF